MYKHNINILENEQFFKHEYIKKLQGKKLILDTLSAFEGFYIYSYLYYLYYLNYICFYYAVLYLYYL